MPKQRELWISGADAAARLNKSERQLARYVERGFVRKRELPRAPGQSAAAVVFSDDDISAILAGAPNQYEPPAGSNGGASVALQRLPRAGSLAAAAVPAGAVSEDTDASGVEFPVWLTLKQAVAYSGLPSAYLRRVRDGNPPKTVGGIGGVVVFDFGSPSAPAWRYHRDTFGKL